MGKLFEAFAIFAKMVGIAYLLPLLIVSRINAAESSGHQHNIYVRFGFDLANHFSYGIYVTTVANAADYYQGRFLVQHDFFTRPDSLYHQQPVELRTELFRQSIYSKLAGYDDANNADFQRIYCSS